MERSTFATDVVSKPNLVAGAPGHRGSRKSPGSKSYTKQRVRAKNVNKQVIGVRGNKRARKKKGGKGGGRKNETIEQVLDGEGILGQAMSIVWQSVQLFGFKTKAGEGQKIQSQLMAVVKRWKGYAKTCMPLKVIKYKRDAFYAVHRHQKLPKKPFPEEDKPATIVGGTVGRWISSLANSKSEAWFEFLDTIQNGWAKGCPRPTEEECDAKKTSTFKILTEPAVVPTLVDLPSNDVADYTGKDSMRVGLAAAFSHEIERTNAMHDPWKFRELVENSWDLNDEEMEAEEIWDASVLTQEMMMKAMEETVDEVFGGMGALNEADKRRTIFPSTSANYIESRSGGGSAGWLLEEFLTKWEDLRQPGGFTHTTTGWDDLVGGIEDDDEPLDVDEVFQGEAGPWKIPWTVRLLEGVEVKDAELAGAYSELWGRVMDTAIAEPNTVSLVALAEALKVRVISKGSPASHFVLKTVQLKLAKQLLKTRLFVLTGRPVDEQIVEMMIGAELRADEVLMSGDYTQATNKVFKMYSDVIGARIARQLQLSTAETAVYIESLTGHKIEDPDRKGRSLPQRRGQLMGSVSSFVVLCILNATVARLAFERANRRSYRLDEIPGLVNGDDLVLKASRSVYAQWATIGAFIGMSESVGKTFVSRNFLQINSTTFNIGQSHTALVVNENGLEEEGTVQTKFHRVKYVNWGLVKGMKRSGGKGGGLVEGAKARNQPGARYRNLMATSPKRMHLKIHNMFKKNNAKELIEGIPWYIPEHLGGLGLLGVVEPSDKDKAIARLFLTHKDPKFCPFDIRTTGTSWSTRMRAMKRIPEPVIVEHENTGVKVYDLAVGKECVNLLFDSEISLGALFSAPDEESEAKQTRKLNRAVRRNRQIWNLKNVAKYCKSKGFKPDYQKHNVDLQKAKVYRSFPVRTAPELIQYV